MHPRVRNVERQETFRTNRLRHQKLRQTWKGTATIIWSCRDQTIACCFSALKVLIDGGSDPNGELTNQAVLLFQMKAPAAIVNIIDALGIPKNVPVHRMIYNLPYNLLPDFYSQASSTDKCWAKKLGKTVEYENFLVMSNIRSTRKRLHYKQREFQEEYEALERIKKRKSTTRAHLEAHHTVLEATYEQLSDMEKEWWDHVDKSMLEEKTILEWTIDLDEAAAFVYKMDCISQCLSNKIDDLPFLKELCAGEGTSKMPFSLVAENVLGFTVKSYTLVGALQLDARLQKYPPRALMFLASLYTILREVVDTLVWEGIPAAEKFRSELRPKEEALVKGMGYVQELEQLLKGEEPTTVLMRKLYLALMKDTDLQRRMTYAHLFAFEEQPRHGVLVSFTQEDDELFVPWGPHGRPPYIDKPHQFVCTMAWQDMYLNTVAEPTKRRNSIEDTLEQLISTTEARMDAETLENLQAEDCAETSDQLSEMLRGVDKAVKKPLRKVVEIVELGDEDGGAVLSIVTGNTQLDIDSSSSEQTEGSPRVRRANLLNTGACAFCLDKPRSSRAPDPTCCYNDCPVAANGFSSCITFRE
ncbi:unnamed protein product, partial [Mesorhabditis spiculigera]